MADETRLHESPVAHSRWTLGMPRFSLNCSLTRSAQFLYRARDPRTVFPSHLQQAPPTSSGATRGSSYLVPQLIQAHKHYRREETNHPRYGSFVCAPHVSSDSHEAPAVLRCRRKLESQSADTRSATLLLQCDSSITLLQVLQVQVPATARIPVPAAPSSPQSPMPILHPYP